MRGPSSHTYNTEWKSLQHYDIQVRGGTSHKVEGL